MTITMPILYYIILSDDDKGLATVKDTEVAEVGI